MKRYSSEVLLGGALIALGALILLQNQGAFSTAVAVLWGLLLGTGGIAFPSVGVQSSGRLWAFIPSATVVSLGMVIGLTFVALALGAAWGGALFRHQDR